MRRNALHHLHCVRRAIRGRPYLGFDAIEVFNDSGWQANKARNVADWFGLLRAGRKMFAVGSSDSHGIRSSPVGYPRTCLQLDTDDPSAIDELLLRVAGR